MIKDRGDPEVLLRSSGLRVTQPRLAVAAVLERARGGEEHLTVAEVVERSREILARVSPQTVYDCLDAMTEAGVIRRVDLPGSPARFETRVDDHHHLVCQRCGAVHNVVCATPDARCLCPDIGPDARIHKTEVVYWGLCSECARRGATVHTGGQYRLR